MNLPKDTHMMQLGSYQFSVGTAAFEKLAYESTYRWIPKDAPTTGSPPLMQYVGPGERSLTINGVIYPQVVANGLGQVDEMRQVASEGKMLQLCYVKSKGEKANVGRILGLWCILSISEERTLFLPDGNPREIHFTMQLKSFTNGSLS